MSRIGCTAPMPHLTDLEASYIEGHREKAEPQMSEMSPG
jgi:hypothetical protein